MIENKFQARKCTSMRFRILHYVLLFRLKRLFKDTSSSDLHLGEVYYLKDTKKFARFGLEYKTLYADLYYINSIEIMLINPKNTTQFINLNIINESTEYSLHTLFNTSAFKRGFLLTMKYALFVARHDWVKESGNCNYVKIYFRDKDMDSYIMPVESVDIKVKDFAEYVKEHK